MPGIYGSKTAPGWIRQAVNGKAWVDIAFFGDSNTGYNNYGWTNGFGYELYQQRRIKAYASNVFPGAATTASSHSSNYGDGTNTSLGLDCYVARTTGQSGGIYSWILLGSSSGPAWANTLWKSGSGLRPASGFNDWAYVSSTAIDQRTNAFAINLVGANNAFDSTSAFIHRVGYLTFASGGGGFRLSCTKTDHSQANIVSTSSRVNCQTGTDGYAVATATVAADATRTSTNMYFKKFGFNEFVNEDTYEVVGGVGFLFESIAVPNRPSYAINCISYASGDTIKMIADSCTTAISALKIYLKEMHDRQVACGGKGRVVIFLNGGINDWNGFNSISPQAHIQNTLEFIANCKAAWAAQGLDAGKLAFMIMPSHATASTDVLGDFRKYFTDYVRNSPDTTVIDLVRMGATYSFLVSEGLYDGGATTTPGTFHLSPEGYKRASGAIIQELLSYSESPIMANTVASLNPLSTVAAYAPDFRGEAKNAWQTPVLAVNSSVTLPKIESYPATFLITSEANTAANSRAGIICAVTASKLVVLAGSKVSTTAAANTIEPTISAGVITLTSNASTFDNPGSTQPVNVVRLT